MQFIKKIRKLLLTRYLQTDLIENYSDHKYNEL